MMKIDFKSFFGEIVRITIKEKQDKKSYVGKIIEVTKTHILFFERCSDMEWKINQGDVFCCEIHPE